MEQFPEPLVNKFFKRVAQCISGSHMEVANEALFLFQNTFFISLIRQHKKLSFNIFVPIINNLDSNCWHQRFNNNITALKEVFQELDHNAHDEALEIAKKNSFKEFRISMPAKERNELNQKWKNFIEIAKNKNPNFEEPTLPFSENYCISNYNEVYKKIYNKDKYLD